MEFTLIEMVTLSASDRHRGGHDEADSELSEHEIRNGTCIYLAWAVVAMFSTGALCYALFSKKLKGAGVPKRIAEANEEIILT